MFNILYIFIQQFTLKIKIIDVHEICETKFVGNSDILDHNLSILSALQNVTMVDFVSSYPFDKYEVR